MTKVNPLTDDKEEQRRAEEFADRMEAEMRRLGSTGDYFCETQRIRWRQHAMRAYLGLSPEFDEKNTSTQATSAEPPQSA
jgi:hypothetical protein